MKNNNNYPRVNSKKEHGNKGRKQTKDHIKKRSLARTGKHYPKMSEAKLNINNPRWSHKPTYNSVHRWINRNYVKPSLCEICKKVKPYDLANITGIYERDLKHWLWLCRQCHMILDGRLDRFIQHRKIRAKKQKENKNKKYD